VTPEQAKDARTYLVKRHLIVDTGQKVGRAKLWLPKTGPK
jgi:hypothetical protein